MIAKEEGDEDLRERFDEDLKRWERQQKRGT
jgi:hypothetical protein